MEDDRDLSKIKNSDFYTMVCRFLDLLNSEHISEIAIDETIEELRPIRLWFQQKSQVKVSIGFEDQ